MSGVVTGNRVGRALGGAGGKRWLIGIATGGVLAWYFFWPKGDGSVVVPLQPSTVEVARQGPAPREPEPPREEPVAQLPPPAPATPPPAPPAPRPPTAPRQEAVAPPQATAPGFQRLGEVRRPGGASAGVPGESASGGITFAQPQMQGVEVVAVGDLKRTIRPGTLIEFALKRALDGGQSGSFSGVVKNKGGVHGWDPYGSPLIEEGASVEGEYEAIQTGAQRLVAFTAQITTSSGLIVPVGNSVVLDELGRAGIPGSVRSRTWARLGNALIYDLANAAFQLPGEALRSLGNNGNFNLNVNPRSPEVAAALLQQSTAIRDEFKAMHGTELTVVVKAPIRFSVLRFRELR